MPRTSSDRYAHEEARTPPWLSAACRKPSKSSPGACLTAMAVSITQLQAGKGRQPLPLQLQRRNCLCCKTCELGVGAPSSVNERQGRRTWPARASATTTCSGSAAAWDPATCVTGFGASTGCIETRHCHDRTRSWRPKLTL